jgi:exodeoxyribonuclease V alpha subunit
MSDQLHGTVERVTYYSEETGYSVIRLNVEGRPAPAGLAPGQGLVTVVGNLPEVNPGESLRLEGIWTTHPQYGRQFKAERCEQILPATVEGIKRYLGSGLVKGVGPVTAARIVQRFGTDTLRVLDEAPRRLREALGVGPKRAVAIATAWEEQKHIREVMLFLQSHGVTTGLAVKIYKTYGDDALQVVQEDPYRLARDIWGVGFKTADKIARDLGLPPDAPSRVQAGVAYALSQLANEGHVYAPEEELVAEATRLLDVPPDLVHAAIEDLDADETVRRETLVYPLPPSSPRPGAKASLPPSPPLEGTAPLPSSLPLGGEEGGHAVREEQAVYLAPFYYGEVGVTHRLQALVESPATRLLPFRSIDWDGLLARVARGSAIELSPEQRRAVQAALTHKVTVLTGGPGTGKTVSVRTIIGALEAMGCRYALCAPTGRAAKRLSEATDRPAKTVHRLLEYAPQEGFRRNEENPLGVDCLIVDESSMLDLLLTNHLLKAVDPAAHVLFVGDVDQLPSVGAGDVLRDVIGSGRAAVVRLTTIFRQAADSGIVVNAHRINRGQMPILNEFDDFYFFSKQDPQEAADLLVDIVQERIPRKFGLDPVDQVQVLAPMYRGACGVANLNARLQEALNPASPRKAERRLGGRAFRVGDKVMQMRNNYLHDVYNGDIGRVTGIDPVEQTLTVTIDGQPVVYDWGETDELAHAFTVSVHKSQGSEYAAVVIPVLTQHYLMLQRNLFYTGITRAKRLVVLVGTRRAIGIAVHNDKVRERHSGLSVRLREG